MKSNVLAVVLTGMALSWAILVYAASLAQLNPYGPGRTTMVALLIAGVLGLLGLPLGAWWNHTRRDPRVVMAAGVALLGGWGTLGATTWVLMFWEAPGKDAAGAIMVALESHHKDHGAFPDELDALVPDYLAAVPRHTFRGTTTEYVYRHEQGTACLFVRPQPNNPYYRCHWCSTDRYGLACWTNSTNGE